MAVSDENRQALNLPMSLCSAALGAVLDDGLWRLLGFRRRPRRGLLFDRFVSPDHLALEDFCRRELAIVAFALMAKSVKLRYPSVVSTAVLARALELLVDGPTEDSRLWAVLRFSHRDEAIQYLIEGIGTYLPLSENDMVTAFQERAEPFLFTERWRARVMRGAVLVCATD